MAEMDERGKHMNDTILGNDGDTRGLVGGPVLGYLLSILSLVLMMLA